MFLSLSISLPISLCLQKDPKVVTVAAICGHLIRDQSLIYFCYTYIYILDYIYIYIIFDFVIIHHVSTNSVALQIKFPNLKLAKPN